MNDSIARRFMSVMDVIQWPVQGLFTFCYGIRIHDAVGPLTVIPRRADFPALSLRFSPPGAFIPPIDSRLAFAATNTGHTMHTGWSR
ncbi:MAG: hypothetical protein V4801_11745 [Burkholderia gladioli]